MKPKNLNLLSLSLLLLAAAWSAPSATAGSVTPKREFRSTWFTTHVNIDWPSTRGSSSSAVSHQKDEMIKYIEGFERMNLTGACFQVRAQCDAVYRSSYEPWSAVITGTRGQDPGWDPLEFCIDECHKRGLECYAWINPFRWSTGNDYKTPTDLEFKQKGWILSYDGYYVLNPAIPEAREHILKVCKEIVDNYAVDGVLFDDYFYPNNIPENSSAGDWNLYKASGTTMSIGDWRRENINIFVREFQKMIEEAHPDMRFGISPAGVAGDAKTSAGKYGVEPNPVPASDWQYGTIYSDPLAWVSEGSIDFISPQIYWQTYHSTAPYEPLCKWWSYIADTFGRHFYSSQNVYFFTNANNTTSWNEVATQVKLNRKYAEPTVQNAPGTIYYSSKYFYGPALTGLGDHLLANVNQTKALVPVVTWKKVPSFEAPENLSFNGTALTWKAFDAPRSILRYTIYAVPLGISYQDACESDGDGLSNDYLLKVCYDSKFDLPENVRNGYWYAVCAYDGLGNEFAPAVVNYPEGSSAKVNLVSPADGATVQWKQKFEWTSIPDARYKLRVSSNPDFSDIVISCDDLNTAGIETDLSTLSPLTQYWWAVTSTESGKLSATSETRSFVTPDYNKAPKVSLVAPADGAKVENDINFSWTKADGVQNYVLEISKDADFSTIRYVAETTETSMKVQASYIGKGSYNWRVVAQSPMMYSTPSDSRSFEIESISIGSTEPGYTIKRDPADYPSKGNVKIENLWMRANFGDFNNISFQNDGMMERGMVAVGEFVYLTRRSENSEGAMLFLEKYDGMTGEHIETIQLGDEARVPYYPLNTLVKDDAENLVIANLTLAAGTNPVVLHKVNPVSGSVDEITRITLSGNFKGRVDHVNVTGNVDSGNFTVYMALSSETQLVRVNFVEGKEVEKKITSFSQFYPSRNTTFTIAPFVTPLSYDEVLVNGGGIGLGQYNITTGRLTDHVGNLPEGSTEGTTANGSERFVLGKYHYTVYPSSDYSKGFRFDILRGSDASFASASTLATIPAGGLGQTNSSTASTPISAVKDSEGSARIYVYAVGNGLSAYRISDTATFVQTIDEGSTAITVRLDSNGCLEFSRIVRDCQVYLLSGAKVADARNTDFIQLSPATHYIVVAEGNAFRL